MAQSVRHLTLDFSSGHDLTVCEFTPLIGLLLTARSLLGILSLPLSLSAPPPLVISFSLTHKINQLRKNESKSGTWVAQLVMCLTSAQVMISRFVGSSPASGSVLIAQSLEPASDSVSLSLCPSPAYVLSLSLSVKNKQTLKKILKITLQTIHNHTNVFYCEE